MREFVERRIADGVPMQLLDGDEAREIAPILPDTRARRVVLPARCPGRLHALCRAFAAAAQRHGARILEGTAARRSRPTVDAITRVQTDIGPISAGHGRARGRRLEPVLRGPARAGAADPRRCASRSSRRSRCRRGSTSSCTDRRRSSSTRSSSELPTFRPEPFATALEERLGLALLESACQKADGSYLLGIAMDFSGFDWKPDLAGVSLISEGMADGAARSCAPPGSHAPGPGSCR